MKKRSDKGEHLTQLILETFRLNGEMIDAGNRLTKPMGLTSARWQVMGAIEIAGLPITVAQIARRMGLARQGVQRIVHDLERLGLVQFEANIDHKRSPHVAISESGVQVMEEVNEAQAEWVNRLASGLDKKTIEQAAMLLQTIRERSQNIGKES